VRGGSRRLPYQAPVPFSLLLKSADAISTPLCATFLPRPAATVDAALPKKGDRPLPHCDLKVGLTFGRGGQSPFWAKPTLSENYAIFNSLLTPFMLRPGHRVVLPERFYASLQRDIDAGPDGPRGRRGGDSESIWQTFIGSSGEGEIDGD